MKTVPLLRWASMLVSAVRAESGLELGCGDGGMINDISLRWAGTPHFYRMGDTIIFYVGDDAAALERLNGSFGTPFAGSSTNE